MSDPGYDVAIVGGGLVGASLAVALTQAGRRVALIEAMPPGGAGAHPDERVLGLNEATRRIFEGLGVWEAMRAEAEPICATHVSERGRYGVARFTAAEAGLPALGYNVPLRVINAALHDRLSRTAHCEVFSPARVADLECSTRAAILRLHDGRDIAARLVAAADGADSVVRAKLGIPAERRDYGQTAVVATVQPERPHGGVAYERFTSEGPIAVLPRPGGRVVAVWMLPTGRAEAVLQQDDESYLAGFQAAFGHRLGRFTAPGRRQSYPLVRVLSARLTGPRSVLLGNAAQTLHPVAAQGFNLGLRDVACLAEQLVEAPDPGSETVLGAYAQRREDDRRRIADFTDRLVRTFSNDLPGLRAARHLGLLALDLLPPLKQAVMRQNLGLAAATPGLVRRGPQ